MDVIPLSPKRSPAPRRQEHECDRGTAAVRRSRCGDRVRSGPQPVVGDRDDARQGAIATIEAVSGRGTGALDQGTELAQRLGGVIISRMAGKDTKTRYQGVFAAHKWSCAANDGGRCRCKPSYYGRETSSRPTLPIVRLTLWRVDEPSFPFSFPRCPISLFHGRIGHFTPVSKTGMGGSVHRGFESVPLRSTSAPGQPTGRPGGPGPLGLTRRT